MNSRRPLLIGDTVRPGPGPGPGPALSRRSASFASSCRRVLSRLIFRVFRLSFAKKKRKKERRRRLVVCERATNNPGMFSLVSLMAFFAFRFSLYFRNAPKGVSRVACFGLERDATKRGLRRRSRISSWTASISAGTARNFSTQTWTSRTFSTE